MKYGKLGSIFFLLLALFIALALSGIPFLVSNHPANMRVDREGFGEFGEFGEYRNPNDIFNKLGINIDELDNEHPLFSMHNIQNIQDLFNQQNM
jgi:hypothetical protein